jgi:23S rRNA U2552 (ribose-2'-O)-methylase RlmE/FtsJ
MTNKKINYEYALYNTDKFVGGVFKHNIGHNYQLLYKNFLNNNLSKILEIGTANGGFAKFLKDNSVSSFLVGADIKPDEQHNHVLDKTNYNKLYEDFYIGDAFTQSFLDWNLSKNYLYDLIIEDGDHSEKTQAYMLSNCNKLLNTNGVYICEDVQTYDIAKRLINNVPNEYKAFAYIWDGINSIGRTDDICIVIDLR